MRYDSLRLIVLLAVNNEDWMLRQIDFDAAYLNGVLQQTIYARVPPGGLNVPGQPVAVKLIKTLYGLKQSGREWYEVLYRWLITYGFTSSNSDPCVFRMNNLVVGVYVDDCLLAGRETDIQHFMTAAGDRFKFKDLGRPRLLLGLEFDYGDDGSVHLHQRTFAISVLRRYGMAQCNGRKTPLDPNSFPKRSTDAPVDLDRQKNFQSIVGSVNFMAVVSRPDLSFTVGLLGSYNSNPSDTHLKLAHQVLRYVKGSIDTGITITRSTSRMVTMYTDASFGLDPDNAKSFSGYVQQVSGSSVAWSSKRQGCVAKSTHEAEYMAASYAAAHLVWTRQALAELDSREYKHRLLVDNQASITLMQDRKVNSKSKHIAVHYHFVRERFLQGEFMVEHVPSEDNLADICTKALPLPTLRLLMEKITSNSSAD